MISDIHTLEWIVHYANLLSLIAIILTLIGAGTSLYFNLQLNKAKDKITAAHAAQIAKLNYNTAVLTNENFRLQKQIAPRYLTEEQWNKLFQLLKKDTELGDNITIASSVGEEPVAYANQLSAVFKKAMWHDPNVNSYHLKGGYPQGINIMVKNLKNTPSHALRIKKAFDEVGISAKIIEHPIGDDWVPVIFIGPK